MSGSRFTPIPGKPGIATRDGKFVVRSPHRKGRPSTFATLKLALAEQGLRRGGAAAASMEPFADYATRWVEHYSGRQSSFSEDSRASYRDALIRVAVPYFGRRPLARITPRDIRAFFDHMRDDLNLATATRGVYAAPLKILFVEAVLDGLLPSNPAAEVRIVGKSKSERAKDAKPESERRPKALPPTLVAPLMAKLDQCKRDLVLVLAFTGLRISEACGLQWRDFGLDANGRPTLRIERQFSDGRYKPRAKTTAGNRTIVVAPQLAQRLLKLRAELDPEPTAPLIANQIGNPHDDHTFRTALRSASRKLGLPWVAVPHQLRHTAGSLLYERGATDVQIASYLGHEDANFTRARYLHTINGPDVSGFGEAYGIAETGS